jgi:Helix-turn-helix
MRTAGRVFPALPRLLREMELRSWTNADLARVAGISTSSAQRVTAGKTVAPLTVEKVARAIEVVPATETATGRFVAMAEAAS